MKIDKKTCAKKVGLQQKENESIAVYGRVSDEEQKKNENIQNQVDSAKRFVSLHNGSTTNLEIVDWYLDDGVSGIIPLENRPQGARLLSDAGAGKFNTVLVWKLDRFGRKVTVILNAIDYFEKQGIHVTSMTEALDTSTPSGRLMLNMLASFASFERETIIERSIEGTNRRAREGQWLGGIVPYGYEVEGNKKDAKLQIAEKCLPNHSISEAGVVRLIYRKIAEENQSCVKMADELNALGIPPAYAKDNRYVERWGAEGKRKAKTAGIWRPSRIRNLVVNTVYKGVHEYGKRSAKQRDVIRRSVPSLVSEEVWEKAQQVLQSNRLFSDRNASDKYLLRGLVKCGCCGLNYTGCHYPEAKGKRKRYYRCNGKTAYRGPYQGKCPAKAVNADTLEGAVWHQIESILLNPDLALEKLSQKCHSHEKRLAVLDAEYAMINKSLADKQGEKERMLDLYRRQIISLDDLEGQLAKMASEELSIRAQLDKLAVANKDQEAIEEKLSKADDLLKRLHEVLKGPLPWETRRQIVELLLWEVKINTKGEEKSRTTEAIATLVFDENMLSANRTGRDSWRLPA